MQFDIWEFERWVRGKRDFQAGFWAEHGSWVGDKGKGFGGLYHVSRWWWGAGYGMLLKYISEKSECSREGLDTGTGEYSVVVGSSQ